jgi:hypothetical protein
MRIGRSRPYVTGALVALLLLVSFAPDAGADSIDLVVMVDVSASMEPYFQDLVDYFINDLMRNMLQQGDRFHLLSFAGLREIELTEEIAGTASIQRIVDKIRLMQPLGLHTDLVAAVEFLFDYTSRLAPGTTKQLVLITDGIHDPPPDSPYTQGYREALEALLRGARSIDRNGWYVHILGMPMPVGEGDERPGDSLLAPLSEGTGATVIPYTEPEEGEQPQRGIRPEDGGMIRATYPGFLGQVARRFDWRITLTSSLDDDAEIRVLSVESDAGELLTEVVTARIPAGSSRRVVLPLGLPEDLHAGRHDLTVRLLTEGAQRLYPIGSTLSFVLAAPTGEAVPSDEIAPVRPETSPAAATEGNGEPADEGAGAEAQEREPGSPAGRAERFADWLASIRLPDPMLLLAVVAALLALLLIVLLARGLYFRSDRAVMPRRRRRRGVLDTREPAVEMLVSLQNSRIGLRNVQSMRKGVRKSVGGGRSDFLIFLVPFPRRIAEIRRADDVFSFRVIRPEFFPDTPREIEDCLGDVIPAVSATGFPVMLKFVLYVSPLERINRLLHPAHRTDPTGQTAVLREPPPHVDVGDRFLRVHVRSSSKTSKRRPRKTGRTSPNRE